MGLPRWIAGLLAASVALAGCGGGGGGGGSRVVSDFTYSTDWSAGQDGPQGVSQRVSLLDSNGIVRYETVIERLTDGLQTQTLPSAPAGEFLLLAELFPRAGGAGQRTGWLQARVTIRARGTFETAVGAAPTSVAVQPPALSLEVPQSARLVATLTDERQRPVFVPDGSLAWSSSDPAVVRVDDQGLAEAVAEGQAQISVRHEPSGASATVPATISPGAPERTKWTILVYLNGANDLAEFSLEDVNEMERVAQNPQVRVLVQWKVDPNQMRSGGFRGTRRYLIRPDDSSSVRSELVQDLGDRVDMGRASTLRAFVLWGKENYPADRYGLIVWNHGNGWRRSLSAVHGRAVSYDDLTGSAIQVWQLGSALQGERFDFIAWDASLMQMLEVAYEVRAHADYVVGSEESPPGDGYPYHLAFRRFRDNPDASTETLVRAFVDAMLEEPSYASSKITQSVVRTAALGSLAGALDALGAALADNAAQLESAMARVRAATQAYSPADYRHFYDLIGMARNLEDQSAIPAVMVAAAEVRRAAQAAVVYERHNANSPGSNGLSIDLTPKDRWSAAALADYRRMQLAADTRWDEWLAVAP